MEFVTPRLVDSQKIKLRMSIATFCKRTQEHTVTGKRRSY
jgi:hypothetical protein